MHLLGSQKEFVNEENLINMLVVCMLCSFFSPFHRTIFTRIIIDACMLDPVVNDKKIKFSFQLQVIQYSVGAT